MQKFNHATYAHNQIIYLCALDYKLRTDSKKWKNNKTSKSQWWLPKNGE